MVDDNTKSWEQHEEIIHKICKQFKIGEVVLQFKQVCKKREKNLIYRKHPPILFLTSLVLPIPSFPRLPFYHSTTKLILEANPIVGHEREVPGHRRKRFVVDTTSEEHELHLVVREYVKDRGNEVRIKIYRFHSQDEKWEEMQHLGRDKVLFVGVKHCFYVETKDRGIPGFNKDNCLVFAANCFPLYRKSTDAHDKKLFGSENSIKLGSYRIAYADMPHVVLLTETRVSIIYNDFG